MRKMTIVITILCSLIMFTNIGFAASVGENAPLFKIKTISGSLVDSSALKGKKSIALIFWATWCPECKKEIPQINALYEKFQAKGLEILAMDVGINDSEARVKKYIEKYKLSYPVAFDKDAKITKQFNVQGTPTVIILDKNGIVRYRGTHIPEDLEEHFVQLMEDV